MITVTEFGTMAFSHGFSSADALALLGRNSLVQFLLIGFLLAVPLGPVGLLCIHRTLTQGRLAGLCAGLGVATADAICALVAVNGMRVIALLPVTGLRCLQFAGGLCILCLGGYIFQQRPATAPVKPSAQKLLGAFSSTLLLTLTTPATICAFFAIFLIARFNCCANSHFGIFQMCLGVFLGSSLWWFLLSTGVGIFHRSLSLTQLRWINRISGTLIMGIALALLVKMFL